MSGSSRLARWALRLSEIAFKVVHRVGIKGGVDSLLQMPTHSENIIPFKHSISVVVVYNTSGNEDLIRIQPGHQANALILMESTFFKKGCSKRVNAPRCLAVGRKKLQSDCRSFYK